MVTIRIDAFIKQKSHAIARKPRDAVAVCFSLEFANIHHKCKNNQPPRVTRQSSRHTGAKTEFNVKWVTRSWSFKVIYFGVNGKPTRDCVLQYNNFVNVSEDFENITTESTENYRFLPSHCCLTSPLQGTLANICTVLTGPDSVHSDFWLTWLTYLLTYLHCQKLESMGYIFAAKCVRLSSFKFLWLAPKNMYSETQWAMAVPGHPWSETMHVFCWKQLSRPYSAWNLGMVPLDKITDVGPLRSGNPKLIIDVIILKVTQPTWLWYINVTDRRTYNISTTIPRASRAKNSWYFNAQASTCIPPPAAISHSNIWPRTDLDLDPSTFKI